MVKYIGSKRRLVPLIVNLVAALPEVHSVCDLFAGTTRVGQGLKRAGFAVHSNDLATYSEVLGRCYIETDADAVDLPRLHALLERLNHLSPVDGWFTETYCRRSRFFQPFNGQRIDAIRPEMDRLDLSPGDRAILLTALLLAADRVDSTTGLQMAYLKDWSPRSNKPLLLAMPDLIPGGGSVSRQDANALAPRLSADCVYADPPYNQHSYFGNYHLWETLIRNDAPETYGVACKRVDCRENRSRWNSRRECKTALAELIAAFAASPSHWLIVSFNAEGHIPPEEITAMLGEAGAVGALAVEQRRYVGATIGVYNPQGAKVGAPTHVHTHEWLFLCGDDAVAVERALAQATRPAASPAMTLR